MKAAINLKKKINSGNVTTGILATFHLWHGLVESSIKAGLDYLIIDMEHGTHSDQIAAEVCALGRVLDFPVLIRPVDTDYSISRRAIDMGPCGFLLPGVESTRQLDLIRQSIYMPPRGCRRPGGAGNYWVKDVNYSTWKKEVEDDFIILPQIESLPGLEHAAEIARHELTTAMAIGPYDLSASLGVCWNPDHPRLVEAVRAIREAAEKAGKTTWFIGDGPSLVRKGFTFICIGEPVAILESAMRNMVEGTKSAI